MTALLPFVLSFFVCCVAALDPGLYYIYAQATNRPIGVSPATGHVVEMLPLGTTPGKWHVRPAGYGVSNTYNITHGNDYPHAVNGLVQLSAGPYITWDLLPLTLETPLETPYNLFYVAATGVETPYWQVPVLTSADINTTPVFLGNEIGTVFRFEPAAAAY